MVDSVFRSTRAKIRRGSTDTIEIGLMIDPGFAPGKRFEREGDEDPAVGIVGRPMQGREDVLQPNRNRHRDGTVGRDRQQSLLDDGLEGRTSPVDRPRREVWRVAARAHPPLEQADHRGDDVLGDARIVNPGRQRLRGNLAEDDEAELRILPERTLHIQRERVPHCT